ncbi:MAG: intradiol ring-cleavage dioxygenase [Verrucomicrobiota bacterium]
MIHLHFPSSRRQFFNRLGLGAAALWAPGALADRLVPTPASTEGPFYPDHLPLDTDNDLIVLNDSLTPAVGQVAWVSGQVLDPRGDPIRHAVVEIWQCDARGVYLHSGGGSREKMDRNFQGFGRFLTGAKGEYLFRTIRPVPYPGRTPHIHFAVKRAGQPKFTTQLYVRGEAGNPKDGIWKALKTAGERDAVTREFLPLPGSRANELAARFDLVLGHTPAL